MKGRWQLEEGFQTMSDGTALENEMSLVLWPLMGLQCAFTSENEDTRFLQMNRNMKTESKTANGA